MNKIFVDTRTFDQLFEGGASVCIPEYQRPYSWTKKAAAALLADARQAFVESATEADYYLGTVVFYQNAQHEYEIIDGQQRITTLLIIYYLLKGQLPAGLDLKLAAQQSTENLLLIKNFFAEQLDDLRELQSRNWLSRLRFTRIITTTEDAAFTFFDTQNNRGVKLGASDYLKAYHLREIQASGAGAHAEALQEAYAQNWEQTEAARPGGLEPLFEQLLWRVRHWRGQQCDFETQESLLTTFQQDTIGVRATAAAGYRAGSLHRWAVPEECPAAPTVYAELSMAPFLPYSVFTYSLRQPLFKGSHFFEYTRKYAQCYALLFGEQPAGQVISTLRGFLTTVYPPDMSIYLRQLMQLCLLTYYDGFGQQQLVEAANCFDYWIGQIRLGKRQVRKEAAPNSLKKSSNNLLDVITQSYSPQQIFDYVYGLESLRHFYAEQAGTSETDLWKVQATYRRRLLSYFNRTPDQLAQRYTWSN